ncbi:MAG: acyl-CoA dehydrogenase, partial [Frankiales bacterium]|nr:acyl-CoA dehydrogenase [Frankiales bacterium]
MTDLLTTPAERQEFRLSVRRFLADRSTEADVRRLADDGLGYDPDVWKQLGSELGLLGLLVPEEQGGQGLTTVELVVALEETGRALLCAPLLSTAVLTPLALQGISAPLLASVADGSTLVAVALETDGITFAEGALTGTAINVLDAHLSARLLVVVGGKVYEVATADATVTTRKTLDLAIGLSTVELSATPAVLLGEVDVTRLQSLAALAAAAHLVG